MDQLQAELRELKEFITFLKDDRAATKEKEKRDAWTKYASLTIVILAVLAAIATQWSGKYSSRVLTQLNESTFKQTLAADQWAFYQAKSIKQNLYEVSREQLVAHAGATPEAGVASAIAEFDKKIKKYDGDKKEAMDKATAAEKERDAAREAAKDASRHGSGMGLAISFYQVAIALCSVTVLTKRKPLWYLSIGLGLVALVQMLYVWLT